MDGMVPVFAGPYLLGEPGEERAVPLAGFLIGRYPVTNGELARFVAAAGAATAPEQARRLAASHLADHPATHVTYDEATAYCAWASGVLGRRVRLPTGEEWEAAARAPDARRWPWGDTFAPERCACVEAAAPTTVPVDAHPEGAAACGAEQMAGNVWEWVADPPDPDGWRAVRGGSYLDHGWGLRASRSLPADPGRATHTTGFRIAADPDPDDNGKEDP